MDIRLDIVQWIINYTIYINGNNYLARAVFSLVACGNLKSDKKCDASGGFLLPLSVNFLQNSNSISLAAGAISINFHTNTLYIPSVPRKVLQ